MKSHTWLLCVAALFVIVSMVDANMQQHTTAEKENMEKRVLHALKLFDRQDINGFKSDLSPSAIVEGLGQKWDVDKVEQYFEKIAMSKIKSKVTTPLSTNGWHVVFGRTISGRFRDGCSLKLPNVVTLVKFNPQLEIVGWNDMWQELESVKQCDKTEL